MVRRTLIVFQLLVLSAVSAWAGTIQDPAAGVEAGSFSIPITGPDSLAFLDPTAGTVDLYNNTGDIIYALTLHMLIAPKLPFTPDTFSGNIVSATIGGIAFTCNDAAVPGGPYANPFFTNCSIVYNPTYDLANGLLTISFSTTNRPAPGAHPTGCYADQEGIAPAPPGNPVACPDPPPPGGLIGNRGHFLLVFTDDVTGSGTSSENGWTGNPQVLGSTPVFDPPTLALSPEPSTWILLVAGGLPFAVLKRRLLHRHR